jgi:Ca-activated chloride channel family protein
MSEIGFSHPWLLLLALPPLVYPFIGRISALRRRGTVGLSTYDWMPAAARSSPVPRRLAALLRVVALLCLVFIAAGIRSRAMVPVEAVQPEALMIVLDISSSMTAEDFSPGNRLEVSKQLLKEFVSSRSETDTGLILLAASPRLQVPVTLDRGFLLKALGEVRPAAFGEDGTAIGSGIASAVNRLRDELWSRRRIILVTDGVNNRGALAPTDAARISADMGIRIDAIGIGTDTVSRYWVPTAQGPPMEIRARIEIDDKALETVAKLTGGSYRRVMNEDELRRALVSLNNESPIRRASPVPRELFGWVQLLAAVSIVLICLEFALKRVFFAELPD